MQNDIFEVVARKLLIVMRMENLLSQEAQRVLEACKPPFEELRQKHGSELVSLHVAAN